MKIKKIILIDIIGIIIISIVFAIGIYNLYLQEADYYYYLIVSLVYLAWIFIILRLTHLTNKIK